MDESRYKKKKKMVIVFLYLRNINDDLLIAADARAQFAVLAEVVVESRARQILLADVESVSARRQGVDRVQVPLCIYVCVCKKCVKSNEERNNNLRPKTQFSIIYRKSSTTIRDISTCLIIIIFLFDCVVHMCTYRVETAAMSKVSVIASAVTGCQKKKKK